MGNGQRFRDSEQYELLEPYVDDGGLVAGYRVEGVLSREPWRHTTYEASAPDGRRVALKLLSVLSDDGRRAMKRLGRRFALRASIEHPHLLPILDWGKVGDRLYVITALCRAPTMADLLGAAPLKTKGALRLLGQLADALEAAHQRGLVHQDLAPERVLVEPRGGGHVLLGDFGIADPEWDRGLLDLTGSTPYLPPEKVRDEPLTPQSNVYSLACVLVACLTGSPPYSADHGGAIAYAHVAEPPPRLSVRRPELPPSIDDVVAAGMAKDPAERLTSARRLVDAAATALGIEIAGPPPGGASPRTAGHEGSPEGGRSGDGAAPPHFPRADTSPAGPSFGNRLPHGSAAAGGVVSALRRHGVPLALVVIVVTCGALGFLLGRSGDDSAPRASAGARAPESERNATAAALERLDARRLMSRRRLASLRTPAAQAAEAGRLMAAYRATGEVLARASGPAARVRSALNEAERAYGRLAAAARRVDREEYAAARLAVRRSERRLERAIVGFNRDRG